MREAGQISRPEPANTGSTELGLSQVGQNVGICRLVMLGLTGVIYKTLGEMMTGSQDQQHFRSRDRLNLGCAHDDQPFPSTRKLHWREPVCTQQSKLEFS